MELSENGALVNSNGSSFLNFLKNMVILGYMQYTLWGKSTWGLVPQVIWPIWPIPSIVSTEDVFPNTDLQHRTRSRHMRHMFQQRFSRFAADQPGYQDGLWATGGAHPSRRPVPCSSSTRSREIWQIRLIGHLDSHTWHVFGEFPGIDNW